MKHLTCAVLAITIFAFNHCISQVTVKADMKGLEKGTWIYYGPSTTYSQTRDSIQANQDGFEINIPIDKDDADIYTFQLGRQITLIQGNDTRRKIFLYPGQLKISSPAPDFKDMVLSGNSFAEQQNELNKSVTSFMERGLSQNNVSDYVLLLLHSIKQYPNSPYSTALMIDLMKLRSFSFMPKDSLMAAYNMLTPEAKQGKNGVLLTALAEKKVTDIGKAAPEFTLLDANGKSVSLKDFKGKYVLLDFWASWCGPCKASFPFFKGLYQKFKGDKFEMISVSIDAKKEDWLKELKNQEFPWIALWDAGGQSVAIPDYGAVSIPAAFLIDPEGKVIEKEKGVDQSDNNPILKSYLRQFHRQVNKRNGTSK